jgi:magnesium chelatase family protein
MKTIEATNPMCYQTLPSEIVRKPLLIIIRVYEIQIKVLEESKEKIPKDAGFIGALSLDGTILPVEGMIAAILAAKKLKLKKLFLPYDPTILQIDINDLELIYIQTLQDVLDILAGQQLLSFIQPKIMIEEHRVVEKDFNQIIGHEFAKQPLKLRLLVSTMF